MFFKAFDGANGDGGGLEASWSTIQMTTDAKLGDRRRSEVAAKFVLEEGRADERWTVYSGLRPKDVLIMYRLFSTHF